jgi:PKD repeat protein
MGKRSGMDVITTVINVSSSLLADFTYTPSSPVAGEEVYFNNQSMNGDSFEWDFGDGQTSTEYSPSHIFNAGGKFNVQLKAFNDEGAMDLVVYDIDVFVNDPIADFGLYTEMGEGDDIFLVETDMVFTGEPLEFVNQSSYGASYNWDFGDGYTANSASPVYSYDMPGTYEVTLNASGYGDVISSITKTIHVVEGVNSALRITVLEYFDEYPVEGASVLLFGSVSDWETETNPSDEVFTTPLGKCVFEGLEYQRYYVDVWEQDHDNYDLAAESVDWIETQPLEPNFIHDFIAYVDYYEPGKKMVLTRIGKKELAKENVSAKKSSEFRKLKENKISQQR